MIERYFGAAVPAPPDGHVEGDRLLRGAAELPGTVAGHLRAYAFHCALDAIWVFIAEANRYVAEEEPWALAKASRSSRDRESAAHCDARLRAALYSLAVALPDDCGLYCTVTAWDKLEALRQARRNRSTTRNRRGASPGWAMRGGRHSAISEAMMQYVQADASVGNGSNLPRSEAGWEGLESALTCRYSGGRRMRRIGKSEVSYLCHRRNAEPRRPPASPSRARPRVPSAD